WGTVIYEIFGDRNKAKMVFEEGLGFDPEHSGILSSLVSLYLDQKEESREEIRGGEEPVPGRAFLHSMAREDYRKAALILKEQLQRREDASTLRHLGELLLKMEDHTEAEKKKYAEAERYLMRALARDNETAATGWREYAAGRDRSMRTTGRREWSARRRGRPEDCRGTRRG